MIATRSPATITHALCVGGEHEAPSHHDQAQELVYAGDSYSPPPAHSPLILPLPPRPQLVPIEHLREPAGGLSPPRSVIHNTGKVLPARPVPILLRTVKMKHSDQFYDFKSVWLDTHRILNNASEYQFV